MYKTLKATNNKQADAKTLAEYGKTICNNTVLTQDGYIKAAKDAKDDIAMFNIGAIYKYSTNQVIYF